LWAWACESGGRGWLAGQAEPAGSRRRRWAPHRPRLRPGTSAAATRRLCRPGRADSWPVGGHGYRGPRPGRQNPRRPAKTGRRPPKEGKSPIA
jgi:hypothetical protein